jgi:hypothetical protein
MRVVKIFALMNIRKSGDRSFRVASQRLSVKDLTMHVANRGEGRVAFKPREIGMKRGFTLMIAAVASASAIRAVQPSDLLVYELGPVSVRPQLSGYSEFNDNVFYQEENTKSDVIFSLSPGVLFLVGDNLPEANHLSLDYRLEQLFHVDRSDLDATQHHLEFGGRYATERTSIEGTDRFDFLSSPLGGGSIIAGRKVTRLLFDDLYRLDYRFGKRTGVYVEAEHSTVDYSGSLPLFDSRTLQGTFGFEWAYSTDTKFFGEAYYGVTTLDSNTTAADPPGKKFVGGFVGARGNFTEKLTGVVKLGYEVNEFENTTGTAGLDSSAGEEPVAAANLSYLLTERTKLTLGYTRRPRVSVEFTRTAYTVDQISIGAQTTLGSTERLRLNASANFALHEYEPSASQPGSRTDTLWGVTAGASWYFETWVSLALQYTFNQFQSSLPTTMEYNQNRVTLAFAIGY